ncbi:hypothetical protein [Roseateles sp.]|uniref:hypothetical protein n=1 Tax=Roseateles sp. TaxID=1971397 RepID=UPI003267EE94
MKPTETPLPPGSLLARLAAERSAFADAYTLPFPRTVGLAEFVEAFYTTRLFKVERALLALFGKPSSDALARAVARGEAQRIAIWTVQAREGDELLMHEDSGATRSWFKAEAGEGGGTTLWFGSAVVPRRRSVGGEAQMGRVFHALLGFHRWYSRALLKAAARRLSAPSPGR